MQQAQWTFTPPPVASIPSISSAVQSALDYAALAGIPDAELLRLLSQTLGLTATPATPVPVAPAVPANPIFRAIRQTSAKQPGMLTLDGWLEDCWG